MNYKDRLAKVITEAEKLVVEYPLLSSIIGGIVVAAVLVLLFS